MQVITSAGPELGSKLDKRKIFFHQRMDSFIIEDRPGLTTILADIQKKYGIDSVITKYQ